MFNGAYLAIGLAMARQEWQLFLVEGNHIRVLVCARDLAR
jgi:hypothetical protein